MLLRTFFLTTVAVGFFLSNALMSLSSSPSKSPTLGDLPKNEPEK